MAAGKLEQACAAHEVFLVGMNKVRGLPFDLNLTGIQCLGAGDLNGSTVVVVVSPKGAAMANIAPRPSPSDENQATGDNWVHAAMGTLSTLLQLHPEQFSPDIPKYAVIVYAMYQGAVALPDQVTIIGNYLRSWNMPIYNGRYQVQHSSQPRRPGQGTVLVDGRGQSLDVWVEDVCVVP